MFEKEAEEYNDNTRIKDKNTYVGFPNERISELQDFEGNYIDISERIIKAFKDGAEFGFQKGIKAKINTTTISDCPIKDEWHYVKDGDLPKDNQWVLVYYDGSYTVCNYHSYTPIKWLDTYENEVFEGSVIAWKEIIPPKEE